MDFAALTERVLALLQSAWLSVAGRFGLSAVLDIAIVAVVLYWLISLISGTSAATLVRGILILLTLAFVLSNVFNLTMLQFLLRNSIPALIFAIPVLFQPEIRRALEQLGRAGSLIPRTTVASPNTRLAATIVRAAQQLADRRFGALLVIERSTPLGEFASKGIAMDALLSTDLLLNIFWPNSPLHDGAVIIHGDRVVAAGVVLPLAQSPTVEHMGTRHRAAVGITEISDAIAIVVSEETSTISLANAGRMVRNLGEARLQKVLSILDRTSTGLGANGRGSTLIGRPHLRRSRQPPEKPRDTHEKSDDSESDAA
ncbi:MAG: diadenylate cyclase CdaA [Chloroflexi bacterium]|nr:diadenylate cyclase CdaA [Chloroflexota bacterium]